MTVGINYEMLTCIVEQGISISLQVLVGPIRAASRPQRLDLILYALIWLSFTAAATRRYYFVERISSSGPPDAVPGIGAPPRITFLVGKGGT